MPIVNIEYIKDFYNPTEKLILLKTVHESIVNILKVNPLDCQVRIFEIDKHNYYNSNPSQVDHLFIEVKIFTGRSKSVKQQLYQALVKNLQANKININNLLIALSEIPRENWGVSNGSSADEVEYDYKIDI